MGSSKSQEDPAASAWALSFEHKSWPQHILYAVFAIFPFALAIFTHVTMLMWGRPAVPGDLPEYVARAIPAFFVLIFVELYVAWRQGKKGMFRYNDSISSSMMGSIELVVAATFRGYFAVAPYAFIQEHFAIIRYRDEDMTWVHWIIMFLVVELGYYWAHRMGHEWNAIWAGHNVHHSSDEYNLFTAFRQSPIFGFLSAVFYLPIALFLPLRLFSLHRGINTIYQFWIHTKMIGKLPWIIEFIFNTPSHHRVHHGRNPQYIDKNYGGTLIIFDRLFGTFEPEQEEVIYGITHMPATWNPLVVQLHHLYECWEVARKTPGLLTKIRVFLDLGPAYNWRVLHYDSLIRNPKPEEPLTVESANARKLRVTMPNGKMRLYGLVHFVLELVQVGLFALKQKHLPAGPFYLTMIHILFSMYTLSACIECLSYAPYLEAARNLVSIAFLAYIFQSSPYFAYIMVLGSLFSAASALWVLLYQRPVSRPPHKSD